MTGVVIGGDRVRHELAGALHQEVATTGRNVHEPLLTAVNGLTCAVPFNITRRGDGSFWCVEQLC